MSTLVDTIYFGGGTPSLLEPAALAQIIATLRQNFDFGSDLNPPHENGRHFSKSAPASAAVEGRGFNPAATVAQAKGALAPEASKLRASVAESHVQSAFSTVEITLEADPETITPEKSAAWRAAGFNRISLGSQSFDDRELQAAGRMHRRADILAAAQYLRAAGFANISMDLIAGLPHQMRASWDDSLVQLLAIRPEHISIYMLEIDEGSRLGKESLAGGTRYSAAAIPPDDDIADFYESACARLANAGYEHYEISNWALPEFRSRHNLKYWRREPYLGFGAGAHSFDGSTRWANVHDSARYAAAIEQGISPREQIEAVTTAQAFDEELFLGLRQLEGIDLARIERDYESQSHRIEALRASIATLGALGLVDLDGTRLRLVPSRLAVSNEVFVELLG
ncbi:MAG: coproporphyrinogen-III oxidase family protein [Candidatus Acidiferrales bacterium]